MTVLRTLKRILKVELLALALLLAGAAIYSLAGVVWADSGGTGYELLDQDLEPFRSAFNAASGDVRAVLLVGPT